MAKFKEIKSRIKAVSNTTQITNTMDMIARSRMGKLLAKDQGMRLYTQKLNRIVDNLYKKVDSFSEEKLHPLQIAKPKVENVLIFAITASRGLCGTYNSHILQAIKERIEHHNFYERKIHLHIVGKKGINYFENAKVPIERTYPKIDDNVSYEDCEPIIQRLMHDYISGTVDRIEVMYTRYYTRVAQLPKIKGLIPIVTDDEDIEGARRRKNVDYLIEPNRDDVLNYIVPLAIKSSFYNMINSSFLSENAQRAISMRLATDNAKRLVKDLSMKANHARQSNISNELLDIIGGSEATREQ